jgi:hypothetical protein
MSGMKAPAKYVGFTSGGTISVKKYWITIGKTKLKY